LITLEGGDGAGKTSQLGLIRSLIRARGVSLLETREPGGTPLSEAIREWVLSGGADPPDPVAELLLVFAARRQHWVRRIEPALESGTWVLCDRFVDSTYAYQGSGRGLPWGWIETLEHWVLGPHGRPDLTLYFDTPVDQALARVRERGHLNRIEREAPDWHEHVRAGYRARLEEDPDRFIRVDAGLAREQVQAALEDALVRRFDTWQGNAPAPVGSGPG
jgi:dTMP kinase